MNMAALGSHPLVRFPDFRLFFGARFISAIGDKFFTIALSWWAVNETGAQGALNLGLLMALTLLPSVLLGPLAGTLADRFDRKRCMILADACRFVLAMVMTLLLMHGTMTLYRMYVLVFVLACFMPLFESSAEGSLASLTDEEGLFAAVALDSSVVALSSALGAALGGIALAAVGTAGAFGCNGATFALSLLLIACVKTSLVPKPLDTLQPSNTGSTRESLKEILAWLKGNQDVLGMLILFGVLNFFAAPLMISIPLMVKYAFAGDVSWVAFLEAGLALGTVMMACTLSFVAQGRMLQRIITGVVGLGASVLAFALSPTPWLGLPLVFGAGAGLALASATALGFFQRTVPDALKGRFFSILTAVAYSVMPLALALNGLISQYYSVRLVLAVDGAMVCLLAGCFMLKPFRTSTRLH
ncbi:MFS transporter [Desulfoplanes formicivorans]|uniref:Antiporter n=1 Tax=Desulfoplanes formicivorans TaxID=1592317 RepID=A0A194AGL5_9BACT|nr:MFS transporter [Desulfoplanes formicivorans]GAU08221.1 antiporter [Desulfoplanes formicivorans]